MGITALKDIQAEVTSLNAKLDEVQTRKGKGVQTPVFSRDVELDKRGADMYVIGKVTGADFESMKGFEKAVEYGKRAAMVPGDLPNWVEESFANDILERMTVIAEVANLFPKYTIPNGTQTLSIPQKLTKTKAYLIAAGADAVQSAITSGKVSFATQRLVTLVALADQTDFETVVALVEVIKNDIAESLVLALEEAILNGDTDIATGINGVVPANDVRATFDGVRKVVKDRGNQVDFGGAMTYGKLLEMRRALGKDGISQKDLAFIVSPSVFHQLISMPEVLTMDKYGAQATVITGEVAKIGQIPVLVSEFIPEDVQADGTGSGDTNTLIVLVNRRAFGLASRKTIGFEADRNIVNATNLYVGHQDVDFKPLLPHKEVASVGINIPA